MELLSHSKLSRSSCTSIGSGVLALSVRFAVGALAGTNLASDSKSPSSLYLRTVGSGNSISLSMQFSQH